MTIVPFILISNLHHYLSAAAFKGRDHVRPSTECTARYSLKYLMSWIPPLALDDSPFPSLLKYESIRNLKYLSVWENSSVEKVTGQQEPHLSTMVAVWPQPCGRGRWCADSDRSKFSGAWWQERPVMNKWTGIKEDTQYPPLASILRHHTAQICTGMHTKQTKCKSRECLFACLE